MPPRHFPAVLFLIASLPLLATTAVEYASPGYEKYAITGRRGSILPGGRVLRPLGDQIEVGPGPFGLAISDRGAVATANIGFDRFGVTLLDRDKSGWRKRDIWARTPHSTLPEQADPDWKGVFYGIAFADHRSIWICEGDSGRIRMLDADSGETRKVVDLNKGERKNSFTTDLAWDSARKLLFVLDQANFRLAVMDGRRGRLLGSVQVGRMPFAVALSPDGMTAYVTNAGVFRYQPLPGVSAETAIRTGLPFPAFGFPSADSVSGAKRMTAAGEINVPGVGDPNVRESNSVCVIDAKDPAKMQVIAWIRTGQPFGTTIAGGSAPAAVVATADRVFVSNAHDDSITVIDAH
jgi:DNA-binding beta-propeller fold protein YncE